MMQLHTLRTIFFTCFVRMKQTARNEKLVKTPTLKTGRNEIKQNPKMVEIQKKTKLLVPVRVTNRD